MTFKFELVLPENADKLKGPNKKDYDAQQKVTQWSDPTKKLADRVYTQMAPVQLIFYRYKDVSFSKPCMAKSEDLHARVLDSKEPATQIRMDFYKDLLSNLPEHVILAYKHDDPENEMDHVDDEGTRHVKVRYRLIPLFIERDELPDQWPFSFVSSVMSGEANPDDIDDWVDRWHKEPLAKLKLSEWLGMSEGEYSKWVTNVGYFKTIIENRTKGIMD